MIMIKMIILLVLVLVLLFNANGFQYNSINNVSNKQSRTSSRKRNQVLTVNARKEKPKSYASADIADVGYPPIGSLIRQGPVPFFIRLTKPDVYEAAVLKYMRQEGCDRATAQGNMDAYFMDPNGWAANKLRERNGGFVYDYVNVNTDQKSLLLTSVWAFGILGLFVRVLQVQILDK